MRTAILTDSNSGLTEEEGRLKDIAIIGMPVVIDGQIYFEGINLTKETFYQALESGHKITTSQPSIGDVVRKWDELLEMGYDDILYLPMSSGLSSSCMSARLASEDYHGKVQVVDNHRISPTLRHALDDAIEMREKGYSAALMKEKLEAEAFESIIYVGVEDLTYLKRGGRITVAASAMGSILHVKPLLVIAGEKLDAYKKIRGTHRCMQAEIEAIQAKLKDYEERGIAVRIGEADSIISTEECLKWREMVSVAFPNHQICYDSFSCSIGCHIGPGAFGLGISKKISI